MRAYDIIKKKRDGYVLTDEEINNFINGYVSGEIPDYQAAALLMAIYYNGMTLDETTALTMAIKNSGNTLDFSKINGIRVDKHSTGGVGDKTSLAVMPIVASLGVKVAKMSGRGLGHTGGTIDKLEAIPGFNTAISTNEFEKIVNEIGIAIVGQTTALAPADKKLYALRDVTATVDSIPLIASSIMGKKLAADDNCIVLDVKTGSGAFMKTVQGSKELAEVMVGIGKKAGKKISAFITDMDAPLGRTIGNTLEVIEAVNLLKGKYEYDFYELCVALATEMLNLAGKGSVNECKKQVEEVIHNGVALETFKKMVIAQGGDVSYIIDTDKFETAKYVYEVKATKSGYVNKVNAESYGVASSVLGAGRNTLTDIIDVSAGIVLNKKTGEYIKAGETIATLYTNKQNKLGSAEKIILDATEISDVKPVKHPIIFDKIE